MREPAAMPAAREAAALAPFDTLLRDVERYYAGKLRMHGACALGVDWACEPTQQLRFVQLLKLCRSRLPFSINDLGCGYGALLPFLRKRRPGLIAAYYGVDLSADMVEAARRSNNAQEFAEFAVGPELQRVADYSVASGVFNVKLGHPLHVWESLVRRTLTGLHASSARGFAVNFLRPLGDGRAPEELYCTQAEPWVGYCQQELGCVVEVLSNYGLKEFTLIAHRPRSGA